MDCNTLFISSSKGEPIFNNYSYVEKASLRLLFSYKQSAKNLKIFHLLISRN